MKFSVLELADLAAVHRVGPVCAEAPDVKLVCALAYLLVGIEGDAYLAVLDFGMMLQIIYGRDDFGDAGLIVGAEQRRAVGDDERLAAGSAAIRETQRATARY